MAKEKPIYRGTQEQLYIASTFGWRMFLDNNKNKEFTDFKAKYTAQYAADAIAEILAAKLLPDNDARASLTSVQRDQLTPIADACINNFKSLRSYIGDAFPDKKMKKDMLKAAGDNYFAQASNEGWEQLSKLNGMGMQFISTYTKELSMNSQNMPDAFPKKYETANTDYEDFYNKFLKSKQSKKGGASTKVKANNAVYTRLLSMLADGHLIFAKDEFLKNEFQYNTIISYITTAGTTGIHLKAVDSETTLPVSNYQVTLLPINKTETADATGIIEIKTAEDQYSIQINHPDYQPYSQSNIRVTTGVMRQLTVTLVKIIPPTTPSPTT